MKSAICQLPLKLFQIQIFLNKVAKLKPIFKKDKETDPSNYRPISFLPLISKVLERIIHDQTNVSLKEIFYYIITNLDSELIIQLTYASHF